MAARALCRRSRNADKKSEPPMTVLSALQYPHWLMVAGASFIVLGLSVLQNKNVVELDHGGMEMNAKGNNQKYSRQSARNPS
jgi:hypothetical protein